MPVLCLGVMDQDVDDFNSIRYPKLFSPGLTNRFFTKRLFLTSAVHGGLTSATIFFFPYGESRSTAPASVVVAGVIICTCCSSLYRNKTFSGSTVHYLLLMLVCFASCAAAY